MSAALLALAACSTEEIGRANPESRVFIRGYGAMGDGTMSIVFPPTLETNEAWEEHAAVLSAIPYHVFLDGVRMFTGGDPVVVLESGALDIGYIASGRRHFRIAAPGDGRTIFAGELEIPSGSTNRLFLVGSPAALVGLFVSYPSTPPAGTLHVALTSLVRGDARIEAVSCLGAEPCAPLSPPLAYGETFGADFRAGTTEDTRLSLAGGATIMYRRVPTAALPAPPLHPLGANAVWNLDTLATVPSGNLAAAPVYMTAEGQIISTF